MVLIIILYILKFKLGVPMKKIKNNVTQKEYTLLIENVKGSNLRELTKRNLLFTYILLYYTGTRLNEIQDLYVKDVISLLNDDLIIYTKKTHSERKLYISEKGKKDIKNFLGIYLDTPKDKVIQKLGDIKSSIHPISYINLVNKHMKKVLGERFTSHSFRQGLLTEMGAKSVNPKIIQHFIGHKSIKTTLNYITPSSDDIQNALVR